MRNYKKTLSIRLILFLISIFLLLIIINMNVKADTAEKLDMKIEISNSASIKKISDESYKTSIVLNAGDTITVTLNKAAKGVYIIWGDKVNEWTLETTDNKEIKGKNGFLHEYIEFEKPLTEFVINANNGNTICDIYCYGEGTLPEDVQIWEPACEKADILLLSSHADDEILFFGGILPYYGGELGLNVQIVYFSQYFTGTVIREHEKLDGLWHSGIKNYPYNGEFHDYYADNLNQAIKRYGEDNAIKFVVEIIRKFKPQVIVAQDENGEYGHGTHMLTAYAVKKAVTISMDENTYPDLAKKYGIWDVPKTYLHLYKDNEIVLDCRKPLDKFNGKTALDIAKESYEKHVSQQWCWFYVDDKYAYSCAKFGLYRTTVGNDTGNDIMENLVDYKTMEEQKKQEEESKRLEEESIKASIAAKEAESIQESKSQAIKDSIALEEVQKAERMKKINNIKKVIISGFVIVAVIIIICCIVLKKEKKQNKGK